MKDINYHGDNLCSIAGIENTFFGKGVIRELLKNLLRESVVVVAEIQRPYDDAWLLRKKIYDISSDIQNLKIDSDCFAVSFDYIVKEENEEFIKLFVDLWFSYEQPTFSFFLLKQGQELFNSLIIGKRLSWQKVTEISTLYTLFKSVEEDVIWIGKSKNLGFEKLFGD